MLPSIETILLKIISWIPTIILFVILIIASLIDMATGVGAVDKVCGFEIPIESLNAILKGLCAKYV